MKRTPSSRLLRLRASVALLIVSLLFLPNVSVAVDPATQASPPTFVIPPPGETQELVLRDGSRAFGRVERVEGGRVTFRTTSGVVMEVTAEQIVTLRPVAGRVVDGRFWPADPNRTRLFFAPTGRSLRRGAAYLGVYEILLPFVQIGITDQISIGGGTPLIFGGGSQHPFWITPKVQVFATKSTRAAVGLLHFLNVGDGHLGVAYGVVTQGSDDSALTLGLGYAYVRSYDRNPHGAAIGMLGGEHRVTRGMKLVTENYLWRGGGLATGGVRLFGGRLSADLGLVAPLGLDTVVAFPMVNFVWQFSRD